MERFKRLLIPLFAHRTIAPLERVSNYLRTLTPGDKVIFSILAGACALVSLLALYSLERSFLVEIPAHGGSLTEGTVGAPRFINPLLALSDTDRDLTTLTYAGLMGIDGTGALVPVLAESYTISDDGKTYTFTLRKNTKFSDGSSLTADDVAFTVQKAQDPALKSPEYADWANVRVEVIDALHISFTLSKAYAPFINSTTLGILPSRLWKHVPDDQFPFSPLMEKPVGAGPFMVTRVEHDKHGVITKYHLSAFPQYALGRPYLDSLHFIFFDSTLEVANALKHGTIESAYGVPTSEALTAPYARVFGVFFSPQSNSPLARPEVRKALSLVIDRTHITDDILGGYAIPLLGPLPPGSGITEPEIPTYPNDETRVEEAKKILTDAGWTYASSTSQWTLKTAKSGTLTINTIALKTSDAPELKTIATAVQKDWEALGVSATVDLYSASDLTQKVIRPRAYEALLFGMVIGRGQDLFAFWDSAERSDPGLNIANYSNPTVDKLLEQARITIDSELNRFNLQKASDLIAGDYPAAFTHAPDFLYAVPNSVHGIILPQITSPSDRFATVATWHRESEWVWPFLVRNN